MSVSSITMPEQYWEKLKEHSTKTGLSSSEIIRRALDLYLKDENKNNSNDEKRILG